MNDLHIFFPTTYADACKPIHSVIHEFIGSSFACYFINNIPLVKLGHLYVIASVTEFLCTTWLGCTSALQFTIMILIMSQETVNTESTGKLNISGEP